MFYSIYAESTPNPEVMKFVSNRMLADKSIEFLTEDDAKQISMIYKIFSLDYVELESIFKLIKDCEDGLDVKSLLKGPVCHDGFKRLN